MIEAQQARNIWKMAAEPLLAGAAMCLAAAAIAGGANWIAQNIALDQGKAQAALDAANLSLENTQSDRARLEQNLQMFGKLKLSHFASKPDRLALLEALESAASGLRKSTLAWELGVQEKIKPLNDDKTGEAVAQLVRVPMKLSASAVHEEEWLSMLIRLQSSGAGYFTTDRCLYERRIFNIADISIPSVDVQCDVSWLYAVATSAP